MDKQILVQIEPQYGKWVYYPACEDAKTFARIAGTKTLTNDALREIIKLGYRVKATANSMESLIDSMVG